MTSEDMGDETLSEIEISASEVRAKPRKLVSKWGPEATQELRDLWDYTPPKPPLRELVEGIESENFDEWLEEREKNQLSPEAKLIEKMAQEMSAEVDRQILKSLLDPSDD